MSTPWPRNRDPLRLDAEAMLRAGTAPPTDRALNAETLTQLFRLASSPDTANDGLKLLHELQVHQVELDLQQVQLEANEREMANAVARYKAVFDFAPVGYLLVNPRGRIIESNLAGAQLLGVSRERLCGLPVADLVTGTDRHEINQLLATLQQGAADAACTVSTEGADRRPLQVAARFAPGRQEVLMTFFPAPPVT